MCCLISWTCSCALTVISLITIYGLSLQIWKIPDLPTLADEEWSRVPLQQEYFEINVPNDALKCLQDRLSNVPFDQKSNRGRHNLTAIINHWLTKYDWRARERVLNSVRHYRALIGGLYIHYIYEKPILETGKQLKVLPLLLLHGWPSSFKEFFNVIPHLTKPCDGYQFVFEVIIPSLPGFGFSDRPTKRGLGTTQTAVLMKRLMDLLGFQKFYVHGSDWGAVIASDMATLYPESVIGLHSSMCISTSPKSLHKLIAGAFFSFLTEVFHYAPIHPWPWYQVGFILFEQSGYTYLQESRPDEYADILRDTPAGLASYIIRKLTANLPSISTKNITASTCSAIGKHDFPDNLLNDLLDNVMIYYATGSIGTSTTLLLETIDSQTFNTMSRIPTHVPTVCSTYSNIALYFTEYILRDKYPNLLYISHPAKDSRFPGYDKPKILADDIWLAIQAIETAGICK